MTEGCEIRAVWVYPRGSGTPPTPLVPLTVAAWEGLMLRASAQRCRATRAHCRCVCPVLDGLVLSSMGLPQAAEPGVHAHDVDPPWARARGPRRQRGPYQRNSTLKRNRARVGTWAAWDREGPTLPEHGIGRYHSCTCARYSAGARLAQSSRPSPRPQRRQTVDRTHANVDAEFPCLTHSESCEQGAGPARGRSGARDSLVCDL